jgi:cytochrome c553
MRVIAFTAACLLAALSLGCRATPPTNIERSVVIRAKHWVFVRGKNEKNPLSSNPETIKTGKEAFSHYCVVCHGLDGQNTGVPFADRMSPPVPSLASKDVQAYTDGQLKWVIDNGIGPAGMPASREILNDDEIWSIVIFLRHLPPAGSLGEPAVYAGAGDGQCQQTSRDEISRSAVITRDAEPSK